MKENPAPALSMVFKTPRWVFSSGASRRVRYNGGDIKELDTVPGLKELDNTYDSWCNTRQVI